MVQIFVVTLVSRPALCTLVTKISILATLKYNLSLPNMKINLMLIFIQATLVDVI